LKYLASTLDGESLLGRLHAIWGLGQLMRQEPRATDALLPLLAAPEPEVRAQVAKVLGDARVARAYEPLAGLLRDAEARPRFFAAIALGRLGRAECVPAVLEMLRAAKNEDVYLRHAGVMALAACAEPKTLQALQHDADMGVRLASVVALRRLERAEVADYLHDSDAAVVLEAARAVSDLPIVPALPRLAAWLEDSTALAKQEEASRRQRAAAATLKNAQQPDAGQEPDVLFQPLLRRAVNAHFRLGRPEDAAALVAFASGSIGPSAVRAEAVTLLAEWAKPSGRDAVTGLWRPLPPRDGAAAAKALQSRVDALLKNTDAPVKLAALRAATKLGVKECAPAAFALVADTSQEDKVRTEALRVLATLKSSRLTEALKAAAGDAREALRNEATRIQAQLKPSEAVTKLKTTLEQGTLREKQNALVTLSTLSGGAADDILAVWLDKLQAHRVPAELQLDVLEAAGKRSARIVKDKLAAFDQARPAADELRSFRECLQGGQAEEGRKIFLERVEVSCVRCHKAGGEGGEVGPDLTGIGTRKPREYLLESITFPNKQIAAGFESLLVTMNNGTIYAGLLKAETADEIELNSPEDGLLKLKKSEIKSRERGLSAMPEEMRQVLSKQDLRNLVEFLANLK
jgi:quinoprotein glucose dehydrogenase